MKKGKVVRLKWGKKYGENPVITYEPMHKSYGRAEFTFCPIFKYGKLKEIHIFPRQQETEIYCYILPCFNQDTFEITSWSHKGVEEPRAWREFWCKEHKTIAHDVYVPENTNKMEFDSLSTFIIRFVKDEEGTK